MPKYIPILVLVYKSTNSLNKTESNAVTWHKTTPYFLCVLHKTAVTCLMSNFKCTYSTVYLPYIFKLYVCPTRKSDSLTRALKAAYCSLVRFTFLQIYTEHCQLGVECEEQNVPKEKEEKVVRGEEMTCDKFMTPYAHAHTHTHTY